MIRLALVVVLTLCCSAAHLQAQSESAHKPIATSELNERTVLGKLGIPLGNATEIDAEIVSGRSLRQKRYQSAYLLKVTHVAGKKLDKSVTIEFSAPSFVSVRLPNHTLALHELKNGKQVGKLNSTQIEELENGYVGKLVRLVVYESGCFSGMPKNLPKDVPVWQDTVFYFSTSLNILAERER